MKHSKCLLYTKRVIMHVTWYVHVLVRHRGLFRPGVRPNWMLLHSGSDTGLVVDTVTRMGPGPGPGQCPVAWCVPEDARILRDSEQYSQHYGDVLPHHIVCSVTHYTPLHCNKRHKWSLTCLTSGWPMMSQWSYPFWNNQSGINT